MGDDERLEEGVGVQRGGVGQKLGHGVAAGQVEVGGDRAELQPEIHQADSRRGAGLRRQLPGEVDREGGGADAAGEAVHGQHHGAVPARGRGARGGGPLARGA